MNAQNTTSKINTQELETVLDSLAGLAGKSFATESPLLEFPKENPIGVAAGEKRIGKPESMSPEQVIETTMEFVADQKQMTAVHQNFDARFDEVMVATIRVFRRVFGTVGKGKRIETMFSSMPPQTENITVGLDRDGNKIIESAVPISPFAFAPLGEGAEVQPGMWEHPQYGRLGKLTFEVRKRYAPAVEGLVKLIEAEIKSNSIYKGQVLDLARARDGLGYDLRHRHVRTDQHMVYNPDVAQDLKYELWGNIEHTAQFEANGMKPVFRVGMEGIYGSGKTETAMVTAKKASQAGMTAIIVKPSITDKISDIASAFRIAEMYAPSLLLIEDWDKFFTSNNYTSSDESTITNLLDGADSKTHQVNVLWTTNNLNLIPKSMMRNGRTDCTITFGPLERGPVEEMYSTVLGDQLKDDVDFNAVYEEVKDLGPSFIRGTFDKARKYSIISNGGVAGMPLGTEDLIQAARVMKKQNNRFDEATATQHTTVTFDSLLRATVVNNMAEVLKNTKLEARGGEDLSVNTEALETLLH